MREIQFRGKLTANGEWSYGCLKIFPDKTCAISPDDTVVGKYGRVDPATVGQYTGLTDIMGAKIFEGDIVRFRHGGEFVGVHHRNYAVEFSNTYVTYGLRLRNKSIFFPFKQSTAHMHDVVVIGNIHDNPELLKEEAEDG